MMSRSRNFTKQNPFVIQEGRFKDGNFNGKFRRDWVEEAFTPTERGEETVVNRLNLSLITAGRWILVVFVVVLLGRIFWLQVVKGAYYRDLANGNRIRLERLEASRGIIYDRNGTALVHNVANFLLYCIPADLPKDEAVRDGLLNRLAELAGNLDISEAKAKLAELKPSSLEYYQPLFIADNIEYERALKIYLESFDLPGVRLLSKNRRQYQLPSLGLSHILGYTGKISESELASGRDTYSPIDYLGKTGLEKSWEGELRGVHGAKQVEVDALGKEKNIVSQTVAVPGHNLVLAIDAQAQKKLEEIIAVNLTKLNRRRAAAVVMDPRNGEILALVNLPAFDNNSFAKGISQEEYTKLESSPDKPLFSRAVSGEYPSGSTIKPIIAAAALQEGVISANTSFLSSGGLRIGQWSFPDWKAGGHGQTDVRKAIAESVNTFFYYIGGGYEDFKGLGISRMVDYLNRFGLGKKLGIDLPNEASGFVPTVEWKESTKKESWYIGDTYHVAIGQGDLNVTPLQVAAWTAYFANRGTVYEPHVVKQITQADGTVGRDIMPKALATGIISPDNIEIIRQGMRQTVVSGSARSMSALPVAAAGKTGTAQWSSKKDNHAWFTGFAPYDDPELVITVLVEEGKGGDIAGTPIAREFMQWYFGQYKKLL